jgi:hypothetical protein
MKKLLFRKPDAPKGCCLLKVQSNSEYFNDCNWLYVELTDALKNQIIAAHKLVKRGKKLPREDMYSIMLWCYEPHWLHDDEILTSENLADGLPDGAIDILNLSDEIYQVERMDDEDMAAISEIRTDTCQLIVDETDFYFQCYVKNTNILLYSGNINLKLLRLKS